MNSKNYSVFWLTAAMTSGILISGAAGWLTPVLSLILGLIFLPMVTLTWMRQYRMPAALAMVAIICAAVIWCAPSVGFGVLFAAVWYGGAVILYIGSRITMDLFSLLMVGASLYLGLIALGGALLIKEHYGVYDFRAVFATVEAGVRSAVTAVDKFYAEYAQPQLYKTCQPMFEAMIQQADAFVYHFISMLAVFFGGLYLFTLKIAQNLCRLFPARLHCAPVALYGVPREIVFCYLILFVVNFFVPETYIYPFDIALTLTGFLFVPAGVGLVDHFMRKWPRFVRTLLKTLMFIVAFFSHFLGYDIAYTALMIGGMLISLSRQVLFQKIKKGEDNKNE